MDMVSAMRDTLAVVNRRADLALTSREGCTLNHFRQMYQKVLKDHDPTTGKKFNEAKLGRWLGWMQGAAAAQGWLSLSEAKDINKRHSNG